ncbi:hypothetical protein L2735_00290 [Shewanella olleyana]|uniref:hypothetical protein n=1 Tax=Shewanella olleyana TaxID=135626 RepID=UPI00200F98E4|nr:hypothetical protein [Shewanella olleyana]MCL1065270.1 hypothetical protein [Shewanella olleyana]
MSWLIIQVVSLAVPALHLPTWVNSLVFLFVIIGLPFALFFAWAFELTPEGIKRTSEVTEEASIAPQTGQKLNILLTTLLVIALGYISYNHWVTSDNVSGGRVQIKSTSTPSESKQISNQLEQKAVLPLAVLPFVNLSNDPDQEYFVDGLTEELLNSLTRIDGLKVTARTSSFAYKNKSMDMRDIAEELSVDYLVEGSVRKSGEDIRITVQLIEAASGSHILSDTFDRKLVNVFTLQENISNQVAAALKLSLIDKDTRYTTALTKLDYIAVEQLVTARSLLSDRTEESNLKGIKILEALDEKYPNTPEIIGLAAYTYMEKSAIGDTSGIEHAEGMAKKALALDNKNIDALNTLVHYYDDFADTRPISLEKDRQLIRYYPAVAEHYKILLGHAANLMLPCEEIQEELDKVPNGIFNKLEQQQYQYWLNQCLSPKQAAQQLLEHPDEGIEDYWAERHVPDHYFLSTQQKFEANPNLANSSFFYLNLLDIGAYQLAKRVAQKFDFNKTGYWALYASISAYMYDIQLEKSPIDLLYLLQRDFRNTVDIWIMAALIKQTKTEEKSALLMDYLDQAPSFELSVQNVWEALGLVMLQYHTGQIEQSQHSAQTIFNALAQYKTQYPESFQFWRLNSLYLIASFYSDNMAHSEQILQQGFNDEYSYWWDSAGLNNFVLSPWKDHAVVVEYMSRIELDRQRIREKYGLK